MNVEALEAESCPDLRIGKETKTLVMQLESN
jgi:hypothetical protein